MKALVLSNDPTVFVDESPARDRLRAYASTIGTLHLISRANASDVARHAEGTQEGGLILHAVGGTGLVSLFLMGLRARSLVKQEGIEIVSAQDPFEYGWIAAHAVRGTSAKLHLQVHTDFCSSWFTRSGLMRASTVRMPLLNTVRRAIADRVLPKADGIRVVSERVRSSMVARYGTRLAPISVIPIAATEVLQPKVEPPTHSFPFALITVGRLEPEKRIEDAIDAIHRLRGTYPMLGLFVVGSGRSESHLKRRVRALGLSDQVVFLGWRSDAQGLMRSAQAYIQTSAYEGYGLTLIEAALARIPIITTDVGIVGEVFTGYEDALVAPVADPAALAVHIAGLIEDVQSRTTLVINAEHTAKEHLAQSVDQPSRIAADLARTIAGTSL